MTDLDILVTGASGQLGALTIAALKRRAPEARIGALVRRKEAAAELEAQGVEVRVASYDDPEALQAAFVGVDRLLLISSSEVGQRARQHANVIDAARASGVGAILYTSLLRATDSPLTVLPEEHVATERALAASGLHHVILRNGWYSENHAGAAAQAVGRGAIIGAAGEGRIHSAAREDFAEAAAAVLAGDLPASGTIHELAGDTGYTMPELAAEVSRLTGREVSYADMTQEDYAAALTGAGLPAPVAAMLADSDAGAARGGLASGDRTLSRLIGRPTTPWQETLRRTLG
ncbi:SDR family oxidoreductase [Wenxinia saemankumensis]|uniref:NAD(P)H dehydrogenase (Quinone) n=1 Tax=Wenxinia saemankumensis TaxID=1447782 RepID=A0A1M6D5R1_9RHOB|nr:SDR family oxidoreductase [Wenxinia saemankumensis]SHI68557.1 NAD(P)H dehydrogenase (quinone) [Wenxinia saemankumensis]